MQIRSYSAVALLLISSTAYAAEMPKELQGNYVYPNESGACENKNYSLTITRNSIGANEFSCKLSGKPKGSGGKYSVPMTCSSEDGSSKSTAKMQLNGNMLKFDSMDYLLCVSGAGAAPLSAAVVGKGKLPEVCRDQDLEGDPKKIYLDKKLTKLSGDHDSSSAVFMPVKAHAFNGKTAYEGTLAYFSNGHDVPGIFFIDPDEWASVCK